MTFRGRANATLGVLVRGFIYLFLALPAIVVVGSSVNPVNHLAFPPSGFTLGWYAAAFASRPFMDSLRLSTELALVATFLALVIGTPAAYAIDRYRFRGREALQAFVLSPMIVPAVVLGIGLLQFLVWLRLNQSFIGLFIGHIVITLPYVVRTMIASFSLFDRTLEQAAQNLRATPLTIVRRITIPILLPGLLSSAVFAFVTSFGNITVSIFLAHGGQATLPIQIFTYVDYGSDPTLSAVSTLVIIVTVAMLLVIERVAGLQKVI
jgi:putative spermidine/putrescine transport system permease protein